MTSQPLSHAQLRIAALQSLCGRLSAGAGNTDRAGYLEQFGALSGLLREKAIRSDNKRTSPVAQNNIASGGIELF